MRDEKSNSFSFSIPSTEADSGIGPPPPGPHLLESSKMIPPDSNSDIVTLDESNMQDNNVIEEASANEIRYKDQVRSEIHLSRYKDQGVPGAPRLRPPPHPNMVPPVLEMVEAVPVSGVTDHDMLHSSDLFSSSGEREFKRRHVRQNMQTKRFFCIAMILALASFIVAILVAFLCLTGKCKSTVTVSTSSPPGEDSAAANLSPQAAPPSWNGIPTNFPLTRSPTSSPVRLTSQPISTAQQPVTVSTAQPAATSTTTSNSLPPRSTEIVNYINSITLTNDGTIQYPPPDLAASPEEMSLAWLIDEDSNVDDQQSLLQRYVLSTLRFQQPFSDSFIVPGTDECNWMGVECNSDGAIVRLNLEELDLPGRIPADLGLLTELTILRLWENQLSGTLPESLRLLTNLRELRLWDNRLTGTIPSWIGEMTSLRLLELDINQFWGSIPSEIGLLTKLSIVDLAPNNLSGTLPLSLMQLTELQEFLVYNNDVTGLNPFCSIAYSNAISTLAVDCEKVDCPCCTQCCGGTDGIPSRSDCDR